MTNDAGSADSGKVFDHHEDAWRRIARLYGATYRPGDLWCPDQIDLAFPDGDVHVTVEALPLDVRKGVAEGTMNHTRWSARIAEPDTAFRLRVVDGKADIGADDTGSRRRAKAVLREPLVRETLTREPDAHIVVSRGTLDCRFPRIVDDPDVFAQFTELLVAARRRFNAARK